MAPTRPIALNQVIALRKGVLSRTHSELTRLHHDVQKPQLITGLTRTYRKIDDADADLPGETQRVQVSATEVLRKIRDLLVGRFDVVASVDWTNCEAKADVVVGEQTLITGAPVSYLLFLEKQLSDLADVVKKMPVLDPAEDWTWDSNAGAFATRKTTTVRAKKVMRNHVLAAATDKHPAQVQVYHEDVPAGYWDTIKFSGALEGGRARQILDRIRSVSDAVKVAREKANMTEAVQPKPGAAVFAYLLAH